MMPAGRRLARRPVGGDAGDRDPPPNFTAKPLAFPELTWTKGLHRHSVIATGEGNQMATDRRAGGTLTRTGACAVAAHRSRTCLGSVPLRALLLAGLAGLLSPAAARAQYVGQLSTFVMDASSGAVLQQANPDLQRYPASLTKLMTLYLAFDALRQNRISLDQAVPVSSHAASMEPSKLDLVPGSYLTVEQAILGLVTKSANDAACALGELLAQGDEQQFAQMMTEKARSLGMSGTTFRNASGLPDPYQVSTARDFATLARHLIQDFPEQYHYFAVPAFMFHGREVMNHDPMLVSYPGADGLKTGYTIDAGRNLVTSAVRGNVRLIGVVLGARTNPQRSAVMAELLDQAFQQEGVPVMPRPHGRRPAMLLASDTVGDDAALAPRRHAMVRSHGRMATRLVSTEMVVPVAASAGPRARGHGSRLSLIGARVHPATAVTSGGHRHGWHVRDQKG